jgi:PAS domain S-box-containing protein
MPDLDGYAVCRQLKSARHSQEIPVIFVTAANDAEAESQAFASGADDYIVKPLNTPMLLARVRNLPLQLVHTVVLEGQFHTIVQSSPMVFLIADANERIRTANRLAAQKFGYQMPADMVGIALEQLMPGYQRHLPDATPWCDPESASTAPAVEINCYGRSGRAFPVDATFSRVPSAHGEVIMVALHDLSERKEMLSDLGASRTLVRQLAARSEAARESERKAIARDVHDELGQVLSALRMEVFLLRRDYQKTMPELAGKLQSMCELVDRGINDVRAIASSLRPAALDSGLFAAIDSLKDEFSKRMGTECWLHFEDPDLPIDELRSVVLYRIIQESLTNIRKYAQAQRVEITIARVNARVRVAIRDDVCGFDMDEVMTRKTYGLLGMRKRAIVLDGSLTVWSHPGSGTRIEVNFPLVAPALGEAL